MEDSHRPFEQEEELYRGLPADTFKGSRLLAEGVEDALYGLPEISVDRQARRERAVCTARCLEAAKVIVAVGMTTYAQMDEFFDPPPVQGKPKPGKPPKENKAHPAWLRAVHTPVEAEGGRPANPFHCDIRAHREDPALGTYNQKHRPGRHLKVRILEHIRTNMLVIAG